MIGFRYALNNPVLKGKLYSYSVVPFQSGEESEPEIAQEEMQELLLDAKPILDEFGAEVGEKGYNLRPRREKKPEIQSGSDEPSPIP